MMQAGKVLQQRYRIDKQIGQGGMGAVYVATDERFGSTVAIKETLCMDDSYRKALEREARLLNSLKHVALPRVSDHFIEENGQFLVMEFIPGDDLSEILEKQGRPFPFERVKKWAEQLLDALEFLHTQSLPVIHRDIKPQNLKLNSRDQIVLLDFGLAKGNPTDAGVQTAAKSIFGYSRNYASLEQIQGTGTDPRSDLYSLAATLYHLVVGHPPEDALTRAMAVLSGQPDPIVPASALNGQIPEGFSGVLQMALELNAASRPASAAAMREMLRDMDSYAYLATAAAVAATTPNADMGSQKTRLMSGKTGHSPAPQAAVKTELLPAYPSRETAVRVSTPGDGAEKSGRSLRPFVLTAAGLVLLLCGLAAGAYVIGPSIFGGPTNAESSPEPATLSAEQVPPDAQTVPAEANSSAQTAAASESGPNVSREADKPAEKQPPRASRAPAPSAPPAANTAAGNEVKVDDEFPVRVGNMTVYRDGKVETPDAFIDERGITPKVPRVPRVVGPDDLNDMRRLTPAQRRKLQILRRRGLIPQPQPPAQQRKY